MRVRAEIKGAAGSAKDVDIAVKAPGGAVAVAWAPPLLDGGKLTGVYDDPGAHAVTQTQGTVAAVEFFIDGVLNNRQTVSPWSLVLDSKKFANGKVLVLTAKATLVTGETASASISVTVDNPTVPVPPDPPPATGPRARSVVPSGVGLYNTNDQNMTVPTRLYGLRFVPNEDIALDKFYSQMKCKGASWDPHGTPCSGPGPGCYAAGSGGTLHARLCAVKPDGTPDLSRVLAEEKAVDAQTRYRETAAAFGITTITLFWFIRCGGVALKGGQEYVMVYRNVHPSPVANFFSTNSIDAHAAVAGLNGVNTRTPGPGSIAGLEAREAVCWSSDGGATWTWGHAVGHYYGAGGSDDDVRLPHYGLQAVGDARPRYTGQPFTAYRGAGKFVLRYTARDAGSYSKAGGYAPGGSVVGVVTVKNERTGVSGSTPALGSGLKEGPLGVSVPRSPGDPIVITHTGVVCKAEWDAYLGAIFGDSGFRTDGHGQDRAQIYAR